MLGTGRSSALARIVCVVILSGVAGVAACSLGHNGTAPHDGGVDAGAVPDTGPVVDASAEAEGGCPSAFVTCNGKCVQSCDGCDAGHSACPTTGTCVSCAKCPGFELECFACSDAGPAPPVCSTPSDKCSATAAAHCPCTFGDPTVCPGKNQMCTMQNMCLTCGEEGSENFTCANGLICVSSPMPPACTGS